jgi:hypothetical protein
MSIIETNFRPPWQPIKSIFSFFRWLKRPSVDIAVYEDESRAQRDFILDMMEVHPDAFQHEVDCLTMMELYHSRF